MEECTMFIDRKTQGGKDVHFPQTDLQIQCICNQKMKRKWKPAGRGYTDAKAPYWGGGKSGSVCWSSNQGPGFQ